MDTEYFTFKDGIITVKISSNVSDRTLTEINNIIDTFNKILPGNCQVVLQGNNLYFSDQVDYYLIDENFDTTIY